jgi:hypothetical protein
MVSRLPRSRQHIACTHPAVRCKTLNAEGVRAYDARMRSTPFSVGSLPWLGVAAIWAGVGLFDATQTVVSMRAAGMHHAWIELFVFLTLSWMPWAIATPLVMRLGSRWPLRPLRLVAWLRHGVLWLACSLSASLWAAILEHALDPWTPGTPPAPVLQLFERKAYDQLLASLIIYYCILASGYVLGSRQRLARQSIASAELAAQLARAQLDALRRQVEPHFLFNTLNAVSGLVRDGQHDRAVEAIARISDFLRRTLQDSDAQEVSLDEELQLARLYLDIEQLRLGERLRVSIDVPPGLLRAVIPRLILQPLIENAVKHGLARRAQSGALHIAARDAGGQVVLTVYNDGPPALASGGGDTPSIGLRNVRGRLAGLHGDAATLTLANVEQRGVLVTLCLPLREAA